jgi:Putative adhesin
MRYAALLAASAAFVAVLTLPRDGRSEAAPAVRQAVQSSAAQPNAAQARQDGQEDFRWSGRIARGNEIEVRGLIGDVRAEPASGDQVEVVGRRVGREAGQVRIEVVESDNGVIICTVYPRTERSRRRDNDEDRVHRDGPCENGDGGELNLDADEARINFTVRVPAGVRLAARTVEGDIVAEGLRSPVDAASVSGDVRVSTTGTARAATVSGNVEATFGETDGSEMEFASVSGNVIVRLAGDVGARVEAHTLSGNIESDFDLRMRPGNAEDDDEEHGEFHIEIGRQASGTIGRGGPELSLNTVSGNIRLLRGR